ncbi:MAG: hypothetical protein KatS3mg080_0558 [Anoxybacillus sp.]|nr:MAG: hypothetical protein KatS3mg080_0558 [Anoxybacillus sp.]
MMLPAFALGGIAFQLPLGTLSDRFSRKTMIVVSLAVGAICFADSAHGSLLLCN